MPGINAYEFVILVVLALVILGPERLPQYARNLARWARQARDLAEDAKGRFKDETGTDFDDVDWKRYDPRQYDPRRIIRDALSNEYGDDFRETRSAVAGTLDSARAATDPRELFRSKKDISPAGPAPTGGVPPSAAKRSTGAVAAGMAGAGAATSSAATGSAAATRSAAPSSTEPGPQDHGTGNFSTTDPSAQVDAGSPAPFDTEAT